MIIDGESHVISPGGVAHVPDGVTHSYRNITEVHFLTIVTEGQAAQFFAQVSSEVEMSPPDIPGVVRVASSHEIEDATATLLSMAGADFSTPPPERTGSAVAAADRPRPRCAGTADTRAHPPPLSCPG